MSEQTRRTFLAGTAGLLASATALTTLWPASPVQAINIDATAKNVIAAVIAGDHEAVARMLALTPGLAQSRNVEGLSIFALSLLHHHREIADEIRAQGYEPDLHEAALALDWDLLAELAAPDPLQVNTFHAMGGSAMWAAARGGAGSQMWRVYQYGGNPDGRPAGAYSPLRTAIEYPDLNTAEMAAGALLSNHATADISGPDGQTPLHIAAARGSHTLVEIFIRKDVALHTKDPQGRTAQQIAEYLGHHKTAKLLANEAAIPRDFTGQKRTLDANGQAYQAPNFSNLSVPKRSQFVGASHRNIEEIRRLLKLDTQYAHAVATTNEAAVEAGAHMGNHEIVNLLLDHGASYDVTTAVMRGDLKTLLDRLKAEPRLIHERGAHDFPLLWYPVIGGEHLACTEALLQAGADVEQQHYLGHTALHFAAVGGQVEMTALLLAGGANPQRISRKFDPNGLTALQIAKARKHDQVVQLLRDHGASE